MISYPFQGFSANRAHILTTKYSHPCYAFKALKEKQKIIIEKPSEEKSKDSKERNFDPLKFPSKMKNPKLPSYWNRIHWIACWMSCQNPKPRGSFSKFCLHGIKNYVPRHDCILQLHKFRLACSTGHIPSAPSTSPSRYPKIHKDIAREKLERILNSKKTKIETEQKLELDFSTNLARFFLRINTQSYTHDATLFLDQQMKVMRFLV